MIPEKRDFRDMAGHCDLEGGTGPITQMCAVGSFMEVFKIDKTFRIHSADSLDPKREDPNMPSMVTHIEGIGSGNFIVARIFIQTHDILKSAPLDSSINVDEIMLLAHTCKELLLICEKAYIEFVEGYNYCMKKFQSNSLKKVTNIIPDFPTIPNLEEISSRFLSNAKKFIEHIAKIFNVFFGTSFDGPNFKKITDWISKGKNCEELLNFLLRENDKLKYIVDLRNGQEHPQKSNRLHIDNFRLMPHNKIVLPEWYLTEKPKHFIHKDMVDYLNYLLCFFEVCLFRCVLDKIHSSFSFTIEKIPDEQFKKECPIKFRLVPNV